MSSTDQGDDDGFLRSSYLSYIIPLATGISVEDVFKDSKSDVGASLGASLDSVEQRESLFFDETVDVFLILRTGRAQSPSLRSFLGRLAINMETKVVNSQTADQNSPPASESTHRGSVEQVQDAWVVETGETGVAGEAIHERDDNSGLAYAIWKVPIFMARPRMRLQTPYIVISATAGLKAADVGESEDGLANGYMQSRTLGEMNLLGPFASDPQMVAIKPRLSVARVSRVAPKAQSKDQARPLKGLRSLKVKIFPAVHSRVRFLRPNSRPASPGMIALLELDFTPFFVCEMVLSKMSLSVNSGTVQDLNTQNGMKLPLHCVPHDHMTFLYRLAPRPHDMAVRKSGFDLDIAIEVLALVRPTGSRPCVPRLAMTWTTAVDFSLPVNSGFGQSTSQQSMQRSHRPSRLSISGGVDVQPLVSPSVMRPDAIPSLEAAARDAVEKAVPEFGITMTFSAPECAVSAGKPFVWTVLVVNRGRAEAQPPRMLALVAIPGSRRRNEVRVARPPSRSGGSGGRHDPDIADAVLDNNVVHVMQRAAVMDGADVVCLSADVRVGPLAANACAMAELQFVALREGVLAVEAVRVIDLGSQEHVDVRDLPAVVVGPRDWRRSTANGPDAWAAA